MHSVNHQRPSFQLRKSFYAIVKYPQNTLTPDTNSSKDISPIYPLSHPSSSSFSSFLPPPACCDSFTRTKTALITSLYKPTWNNNCFCFCFPLFFPAFPFASVPALSACSCPLLPLPLAAAHGLLFGVWGVSQRFLLCTGVQPGICRFGGRLGNSSLLVAEARC